MKNRFLYIFLIFGFLSLFTFASAENLQFSATLEPIKSYTKVKFEDISLPILQTLSLSQSDYSKTDAINVLLQYFPSLKAINQKKDLTYKDIAFISMQIWNIRGGFFYSIFQNKHYSFKELQYTNYIKSDIDPLQKISGTEAYNLLIATSQYENIF